MPKEPKHKHFLLLSRFSPKLTSETLVYDTVAPKEKGATSKLKSKIFLLFDLSMVLSFQSKRQLLYLIAVHQLVRESDFI